MNKPNPVVRYLPGLLICLAALAAAPSGPAQTLGSAEKDKVGEPAKAAAAGTDNDTEIVLSPFLVSTTKDTGYTATNSQAGTKMNTNVKDLPFSVDVLTADFIHDIGAQRVLDALAYTTSVNVTSTNESDPLISVRGLPASVLRDGLTTFIQPDLAMVDRIEVIEGASAIAYGQTQPGGVINIVTKQADPSRRFGSIEQVVGQWDNYVTRFDFNEPLVDRKFAFRFSGSYTNSGSRRDDYHKTGSVVFPEFTWRPSARTTISVQFARDQNTTTGLFAGLPANYGNSTAGFNYLNQNYTAYYNATSAADRVKYGLPAPSSLVNAQVGGPAPIFQANPYTLNPTGGDTSLHETRYDYVGKLQQALVENGRGAITRSDLQVSISRIDDRVYGLVPTIDGAAPQGTRGFGVYSAYDADMRDANYYNWTGALWAMGFDYNYANATPNAASQAGYYFQAGEATPGAKNIAGSGYYYTPDLTQAGMSQYVPIAGANTYEWTPIAFRLKLLDDTATIDDVTTIELGKHNSLRLLLGAEFGQQKYWDYGRKGQLAAATGTSTAALAQNYIRSSAGWSATAWGPAAGNGFVSAPEWGYAFTEAGSSNPGTLYGAGANRAYRGWYLWNADTGARSAAHVTGEQVLALADQYLYGLSQDVRYSAYYSTAQLDLFDKRLSLLGAVRYSDVKKYDYRVYGNVPEFPIHYRPVVPQAGVVFNLTPAVNLYASYSENYYYQWSRQTNQISELPPIITANTKEIGTKFQLFGGRLSGRADVYESVFHNLTYFDYTFDLTTYNPSLYPQLPNGPGNAFQDQYGINRFNGATRTRGEEINLQYRLLDGWDLVGSYSHMKSIFIEGSPWTIGETVAGVPEHSASLWNKISFKHADGWIKNFALGLGAKYDSPTYVGTAYDNEGKIAASSYYWKTPVFIRYDAFLGYYFKALDRAWAVTLNVKNLANRTNWTTDSNLVPDGQGREFILSVKVDF